MATQFSKLSKKYVKIRKINNMQIAYKNLNTNVDLQAIILKTSPEKKKKYTHIKIK